MAQLIVKERMDKGMDKRIDKVKPTTEQINHGFKREKQRLTTKVLKFKWTSNVKSDKGK